LSTADVGDILLFRGSHTGSKITRTFTGSHFDHVAMVLYFEEADDPDDDNVFLLDATGEVGVAINKWSHIRKNIGDNKFYRKCIHRRTKFDRSPEIM
jgi:hypothetical protein